MGARRRALKKENVKLGPLVIEAIGLASFFAFEICVMSLLTIIGPTKSVGRAQRIAHDGGFTDVNYAI
jgi:hypothetical protein